MPAIQAPSRGVKGPSAATAPVDHGDKTQYTSLGSLMALMIEGLIVHQQSLKLLAKNLSDNASVQMFWNNANKRIHYSVVPVGASQATIAHIQNDNSNYDAERQNIEDLLITLRQTAHVSMTDASAETNAVQQQSAQLSFLLRNWASAAQSFIGMTSQGG